MSTITEVELRPDEETIARVQVAGELSASIPWSSLHQHWTYADDYVEYVSASTVGPYLVIGASVCDGQGGVVAIWSAEERDWIQVIEAAYVVTAMIFPELGRILSLHHVLNTGPKFRGSPDVLEVHELKPGMFQPFDYEGRRLVPTWARENMRAALRKGATETARGSQTPPGPNFGGIYFVRSSRKIYVEAASGVASLRTDELT
jgi:hypothetical protein